MKTLISKLFLICTSLIVLLITPVNSSFAATFTAAGDSNGYCSQNVTLNTGNALSVSLVGSTCVVQFTGVGSYTWTRPNYINRFRVLVIGGGGGGGGDYGGGGGAGGFIDTYTTVSYSVKSTTVIVGNGGAGNAGGGTSTAGAVSQNGETSTVFSFNSPGGGGGGSPNYTTDSADQGRPGASGGGSSKPLTTSPGANGISGLGSNGGGSTYTGTTVMSGGGGGAGGVGATGGTNTSSSIGGAGGIGKQSDITGINTYYSGGGGGGTHSGTSGATCSGGGASSGGQTGGGASGGNGGGGAAGKCLLTSLATATGNAGANGENNTGGGGGGGSVTTGRTTNARGGNGGSGVVIISYNYLSNTSPEITVPNPNNVVYRKLVTITSSSAVDGTVNFFANNKKIVGCQKISAVANGSNFDATCSWRPSNRGNVRITATVTPRDTGSPNVNKTSTFFVLARSGTR